MIAAFLVVSLGLDLCNGINLNVEKIMHRTSPHHLTTPHQTNAILLHSSAKHIPCTFLNLEHRNDRRKLVEAELLKVNLNCTRTEAVNATALKLMGTDGCRMSHLKALAEFRKANVPYALILEDDVMWKPQYLHQVEEYLGNLEEGLKTHPVILLSCNGRSWPIPGTTWLDTVKGCLTTSSYAIRKDYIPVLENLWSSMETNDIRRKGPKTILDIEWKKLQKKDNWAVTNPRLVVQRASYSDIEHTDVDYEFRILKMSSTSLE